MRKQRVWGFQAWAVQWGLNTQFVFNKLHTSYGTLPEDVCTYTNSCIPCVTCRILIATTNRTFKSSRATQDFGYKPDVSMHDAMVRTLASFQHLRNPRLQKKAS